jgi:hypothetical protein
MGTPFVGFVYDVVSVGEPEIEYHPEEKEDSYKEVLKHYY